MANSTQSIIETRRPQMFPILEPDEIERVRRFGKVHTYAPGEPLATVGQAGLNFSIVLAGNAVGGDGSDGQGVAGGFPIPRATPRATPKLTRRLATRLLRGWVQPATFVHGHRARAG
jgi:hypothetical protein